MTRQHAYFEGAVDLNGIIELPFRVKKKVVFVSNDSDSIAIQVNFDGTCDETGTITLMPYEILDDLPITARILEMAVQ